MFSWLGTDDRRKKDPEVFQTVSDGLKKLYKTKLLPLEESYKFHEFHSPALEDADFDNKPMVLLVGQYSTGKTSFIRWEIQHTHTKSFIYIEREREIEWENEWGRGATREIGRERLTHPNWLLSSSGSEHNWHKTLDRKWWKHTQIRVKRGR